MLKKVNLPKKALKAYLFTQKSTKKVLKKSKFPQKRSQTSIFPQNRDEKSCRCCRYLFWVILGHFWTNFCANFFRQNIALCYSNHFLQLCILATDQLFTVYCDHIYSNISSKSQLWDFEFIHPYMDSFQSPTFKFEADATRFPVHPSIKIVVSDVTTDHIMWGYNYNFWPLTVALILFKFLWTTESSCHLSCFLL